MEKLEKLVSKQTYEKLCDAGITNWEELFKIHKDQKDEFWNDFSKTILESDRKKLEKVIYRECRFDNDKFYFHNDECLKEDGTFDPRPSDDIFELIRFEKLETRGNMSLVNYTDDFLEEKVVIDRIERNIKRTNKFTDGRVIKIASNLDYYLLNTIFFDIAYDEYHKRFNRGFIESTRYCTYTLTYANGVVKTYNIWASTNHSRLTDLINKHTVVPSYK